MLNDKLIGKNAWELNWVDYGKETVAFPKQSKIDANNRWWYDEKSLAETFDSVLSEREQELTGQMRGLIKELEVLQKLREQGENGKLHKKLLKLSNKQDW